MQRSNYFNDENVYSDDLNNTEATKASAIIQYAQSPLGQSGGYSPSSASVHQGGIYGSPADYLVTGKNLFCAFFAGSITMSAGSAIDVSGNIINVPYAPSPFNKGNSNANYSWVSTPNVLNYVKIAYQETSGSMGADDQGNVYATRYYASYFINIDGVLPTSNQILLATFVADSTGFPVSALIDQRTYARTITPASAVILDPTLKVVSTFISVEDHINAIGSGIPSIHNPHGQTVADFGYTDQVTVHRLEAHDAAIIDTTGSFPLGSFFTAFTPSMNTGGPIPFIQFQAPSITPTAAIEVGGNIYSAALPNTMLASSSVTGPIIFPVYWTGSEWATFNGDYYVFLNASGNLQAASSSVLSLPYNTPDKYMLCSLTITGNGSGYTSFMDLRSFYSITQEKIRADFVEEVEIGSTLLDPVINNNDTLLDNLNRIRYQLGMAINGSGNSWNTASPPLTAGPTSNANNYHTHSVTPISTFTINSSGGYNPTLYLGYTLSSLFTRAAIQFNTISNELMFYGNTSMPFSTGGAATGSFGAINIGNTIINASGSFNLVNYLEGGSTTDADSLHTHASLAKIVNVPAFFPATPVVLTGISAGTSSYIQNTNLFPQFVTFYVQSGIGAVNASLTLNILFCITAPGVSPITIATGNASAIAGATPALSVSFMVPALGYWAYNLSQSSSYSMNVTYVIFM